MDLSFVILTWNSAAYIENCFESILQSLEKTSLQYEIYIVDNGSSDQTIDILQRYKDSYQDTLNLIYLENNVGTTVSRNLALKQVTGDYIVVMDSDVEVPEGIFEKLISTVNESVDIGMVVPKIFYPSGKWQKSVDQFPTLWHKLNRFFRLRAIEEQEGVGATDCQKSKPVDYAISAFWLFKKEILEKVGLLDENYFYAPEDVDYCLEVWKAGYQVIYDPSVSVVHHTQEISRGIKFNKAKLEHLKGLAYLFKKHRYLFRAPDYKLLSVSGMQVLFLAYYFPPESSSGSFRPLFFANHLSDMNCSVQVVTARIENFLDNQPIDENLLGKLNPQVKVIRSAVIRPREALIRLRDCLFPKNIHKAPLPSSTQSRTLTPSSGWFQSLKDSVTDFLATPDPQVGWIWSCVSAGKKIIQRGEAHIIWATGSPWSGLVAGAILKKISRKPLILDFRDPWVSNPNFSRRTVWVKFIDRALEKFVVKNADLIVANTEELKDDFKQRYRTLSNLKVTSITNGFEEYLPCAIRSLNEPLTITHTGALYFSRNPVELLQAVSNLLEHGAIKPIDLRLQFVGGIDIDDPRIRRLLGQPDMKTVVVIIPRVSYDEVQQYVCQSDVLLMIQPDFPLQIPRKLYEYMAARKPMLCLSEKQGATAGMMSRFKLGYLCENKVNEIEQTLLQIYRDWQSQSLPDLNDSRCDACLNKNLSAALGQTLQEFYKTATTRGTICE